MKSPKNSKEVSKSLGMVGWYQKFIPKYADICEPLYRLKKKGAKFNWSMEAQDAFDKIKRALTEAPVLQLPNFIEQFNLFTVASGVGIGAVLNQNHSPIAFAFRTLNKAERNYAVTERECLAVIWALNKFKTYFGSLLVKVITDHEALTMLTNGKNLSSRMIRWALKLSQFNIEWEHRPGVQNVVTDVLSRNPVGNMDGSQISCAALRTLALNSREQLIREQRKDPEIGHFYRYLENPDDGSVNAIVCEGWSQDFKLIDVLLFYAKYSTTLGEVRVYIPRSLREAIMQEFHDLPLAGHLGKRKTYLKLRDTCYFQYSRWIACFVEENHENWDQFLHEFVFALHASVNETTNKTPAKLFLGRKIIKPFSKLINVAEGAEYVGRNIEKVFDEARQNTRKQHKNWGKYYNRKRREVNIKVNDLMLVQTHFISAEGRRVVGKFMPKLEWPYRVLEVRNNNLIIWKKGKRVTVNIDQVRVYRPRQSDTISSDSHVETLYEGQRSSNGSSRSHPGKFKGSRTASSEESNGRKSNKGDAGGEDPRLKRSEHRDQKRPTPEPKRGIKRAIPSSVSSQNHKHRRPNNPSQGSQSIAGPSHQRDTRQGKPPTEGSRHEGSKQYDKARETRTTKSGTNRAAEKRPVRSKQATAVRPCPYYLRSRVKQPEGIPEERRSIRIDSIP
ncbi:retrovirus-related Pol polyprotein from transposon 17.6 [Trichonephila clavipes]|nr:retrovirus-related Pol polyprotein from transposon 17.6 [Trichonephila clavipes]